MDKMNNKPLFNIEEFPNTDIHVGGFWTRQRYPGLDALINAMPTVPPWERLEFLHRHFECILGSEWRKWLIEIPVPSLASMVFRLSDRPFTVLVLVEDPSFVRPLRYTYHFYHLVWRVWWRKIDPRKDKRLRVILSGAMALDALAGREP